MFLGNVGIISVISSLILSFISIEKLQISAKTVALVGGIATIWILAESNWVDRQLSYLIDLALEKYTSLTVQDYYSLLHLADNYRVSELKINEDDWMVDKSLDDMKLRDEGARVPGIQRKDGDFVGCPRGETEVYKGDTLIIYGRASLVESLDKRSKGILGDQSHDVAIDEQQKILDEQKDQKEEK